MAALTQYLWEDYLLNSDTGEAAKLKAQQEEEEERRLELARNLVTSEIQDMRGVIKDGEALAKAVMEALDNPVDYEYSIDLEGNIYPGRYTKATKVPIEERKPIPTPLREGHHILGIENTERQQSNS